MKAGFRKAHMCAHFVTIYVLLQYTIYDMNYRQMHAYALYGISQKSATINGIDLSIHHHHL